MSASVLSYLWNALWQAPLLFGTAWLLAFAVRRLGPRAEHRLWVTTLLAEVVLPAVAAPWLATALRNLLVERNSGKANVTILIGPVQPMAAHSAWWPQAVLLLYGAAIAFAVGRFAWQSVRLRSLRRTATPLVLPAEAQAFLQHCRLRLSVSHIALWSAEAVGTPFTYGVRRPVLVLPHGFVERASAPQVYAALAHELAHIHRNDFAKQLLYRLLALPLAMHPAVMLTMRGIAESREQVCDAMAAELTGGTRRYAESLLGLASLLAATRPAPTPAVGIFDANRFERRIHMLRHPLPVASRTRRTLTLAATAVLATVTCTSALALHRHLDAPEASPAVAATAQQDGHAMQLAPGIAAGQVEHKVQPKYPAEAKRQKVQGSVVLHAVIGKDGHIDSLQVMDGPEQLRASAIDAVRQWIYKPYVLNGEPTAVDTNITVTYSLGEGEPAPAATQSEATQPRLVHDVEAKYPAAAKQAKISGEVMVALLVRPDGHVTDVDAVSGPAELRAAAVDAVKQYVFQPATLHGEAIPAKLRVSVNFQTF